MPPPIKGKAGEVWKAMNTGAFAERVVVDRSQIVPVADAISPEAASLLACGVITGVGAVVNSAQVRPGQDVVVIGAGGVGLNAIRGAHRGRAADRGGGHGGLEARRRETFGRDGRRCSPRSRSRGARCRTSSGAGRMRCS